MDTSRRQFLTRAALGSLALAAAARASAAEPAPATCVDPASLPLSQKNRRRSLGYVDNSADANRRCGVCAFYVAGQGGCGTCQILSGGPVSASGVCTSFARKPG